jgi:hypothetical protein
MLLYQNVLVSTCSCTGMLLHQNAFVLTSFCTGGPLYRQAFVPARPCTGTLLYRHALVPVCSCTCTCTVSCNMGIVRWHFVTGVPLYRHAMSCTASHWHKFSCLTVFFHRYYLAYFACMRVWSRAQTREYIDWRWPLSCIHSDLIIFLVLLRARGLTQTPFTLYLTHPLELRRPSHPLASKTGEI